MLNGSICLHPGGKFENRSFVVYNEHILIDAGGSFASPPSKEAIDAQDSRGIPDLIREFGARDVDWGFKDPRTILVWSHYSPHLTPFMDPRIIVTHRNPLNAARSWVKMLWMNRLDDEKQLDTALASLAEYERRLADITMTIATFWPVCHVSFEDWWQAPERNKDALDGLVGRALDYGHFDERFWRS
jgi:hypothetical protein